MNMPCVTGTCRQGREPCPTPWTCGQYVMHRQPMPPLNQSDGGMSIEYAGDEPDTAWALILDLWVAAKMVAVFLFFAALFFAIGFYGIPALIESLTPYWARAVAMLS